MNQAECLQNNRFVRRDPEAQQEVDRKSLTWMMPPLQPYPLDFVSTVMWPMGACPKSPLHSYSLKATVVRLSAALLLCVSPSEDQNTMQWKSRRELSVIIASSTRCWWCSECHIFCSPHASFKRCQYKPMGVSTFPIRQHNTSADMIKNYFLTRRLSAWKQCGIGWAPRG